MGASDERVRPVGPWPLRLAGAALVLGALALVLVAAPLAAAGVALAGFHVGTRRARGPWYAAVALLTCAVLLAVAVHAGLDVDDLGLRGGGLVALGVLGVAAAALPLARLPVVAARLPATAPVRPVLALTLDLPIGTVLLEELAFRSVGLALLMQVLPTWLAVAVSSALFGLWHVWGAVETSTRPERPRAVGTSVAFTALAGAGLCVLRLWVGSVLPAMAVHYAANGWGILATTLARRSRPPG